MVRATALGRTHFTDLVVAVRRWKSNNLDLGLGLLGLRRLRRSFPRSKGNNTEQSNLRQNESVKATIHMWLPSGSHVAYIRVTQSWKTQMPDAKDDQNIPIREGANLRNEPTSYYHLLYHRIEAQILNTHSPWITTPCIPRINAIEQ